MLGVDIVEIPGAKSVLQQLHNEYEILIATNGPMKSATEKLVKAELSSYVNNLISSEEVGFSKPSYEFFNFLFNKTENKEKDKMLLIGDSLTTDILGGMNNGIDTCWFNPKNISILEKYTPTMTINKLLELKKKL